MKYFKYIAILLLLFLDEILYAQGQFPGLHIPLDWVALLLLVAMLFYTSDKP